MGIAITRATDLGGFEFDLSFDPSAITVTHVQLGDFLGRSGNQVVALGPRVTESGRLSFGAFSYGEHGGAGGDGILAWLECVLLDDVGTTLRLEAVQLALRAGVRTVVLFHHRPTHDDATLDRMGQEAATMATGRDVEVLVARDGMVVDVGGV